MKQLWRFSIVLYLLSLNTCSWLRERASLRQEARSRDRTLSLKGRSFSGCENLRIRTIRVERLASQVMHFMAEAKTCSFYFRIEKTSETLLLTKAYLFTSEKRIPVAPESAIIKTSYNGWLYRYEALEKPGKLLFAFFLKSNDKVDPLLRKFREHDR